MKYNHVVKRMEFDKNELYKFFTGSVNVALCRGRAYLKNETLDELKNWRIAELKYDGFVYYLNRVINTSHEYLRAGGRRPLYRKLNELNQLFYKVSGKHAERREKYWSRTF